MIHAPSFHIAQNLPALTGASVQRIPPAPLVERIILEQPWPLASLLLAAGLTIAFLLVQRQQVRRAASVALAAILLAAANILIASLITTDRERCRDLTRSAVAHVLAGDSASLARMLRSDLLVRPFPLSRESLLTIVESRMRGDYAVKDSSILSLTAVQDAPDAVRTQIHLRVTPTNSIYGYPTGSWWILTWQRANPSDPNPWVLTQIECQHIDGVSNLSSINPR